MARKGSYICLIHNDARHLKLLTQALHDEFGEDITYVVEKTPDQKIVKLHAEYANMYMANMITQFTKGFRVGSNLDDAPHSLPTLLTMTDNKFMVIQGNQHWIITDINDAVAMMKDLWEHIEV